MTFVKTTYNRRSFFKASALAGGGMMLGFSWLASCKPTPEQIKSMPKEWFEINGFLKIGENGLVTIMSPNPEIGQNVKTSMPMIVAEELDVDWDDVVVEQAALDTDVFSGQVAGGSNSIRRGWESLRMAGATARAMLLEAAAAQLQCDKGELTTEKGNILQNGKKVLGYGDVASAASKLDVPEGVTLKDPKDFKIIGTSRKNVDGPKIVTGQPLFGLDVDREGMLIATIAHAPAFGMKIKSVDDSEAKAMPGIKDVIRINTAALDNVRRNVFGHTDLVAVVGESTWQVMKAKKALKIEWEGNPKNESSQDHDAQMTAMLGKPSDDRGKRVDGNPDQAFASAAKVIERTFSAPFLAHNTMEPMNFFADVTDEKAELLGPIQTPEATKRIIVSAMGYEPEQVTVDMTRMGGGFGRRLYGHFALEAAMISKAVKAPVKLVYSREDDMTYGTYRPAYKVKYKAALNDANELIALEIKGVGAHGGPVFSNRFPAGTLDNYSAGNNGMSTKVTQGAWRAPRSNFIAGAEQSFLDEIAEAAGKDPIDFRLELFQRAIDNPVGEENDYDPERYAGVLKLVREKSGWGKEMPGVHRGVAAYFCHRSYVAQVVDIVMKNGSPTVQKIWSAVDCGIVINPDAAKNLIEGGAVDGIGHALYGGFTFENGEPQQKNFDTYKLGKHKDAPIESETFFVDNGIDPTGLGEPGLPPVIGALANAIYKATGERLYEQPFANNKGVFIDTV